MNTGADVWLQLIALRIIGNFVLRKAYEAEQLAGIDQATVDREFWDLVGCPKE